MHVAVIALYLQGNWNASKLFKFACVVKLGHRLMLVRRDKEVIKVSVRITRTRSRSEIELAASARCGWLRNLRQGCSITHKPDWTGITRNDAISL